MAIFDKNGAEVKSAYDKNGVALEAAYDIDGQNVFDGVDFSKYKKSEYCAVSVTPMQGFDIFDGVIFQMLGSSSVSNKMVCVYPEYGTKSTEISTASDHGDSASFSDEFYDASDPFPLLYVTADTSPAKVYINRVSPTFSQLVRTLFFPIEKAGYYAALCLDSKNKRAYMVGYSLQDYQSGQGGTNKVLISSWDLNTLTENQDGTFTPAYISTIERPFIYTMQGQQFHAGLLWIASGATNTIGFVHVLNPYTGEMLYSIDTGSTDEIEGLAFLDENKMVVGHQGGRYDLYEFGEN